MRAWLSMLTAAAPGLAAREAARLFFTPDRKRAGVEPGPVGGVAPEPFRARAGERRIAAWSYGRGPTVLLVHGWAGSARDWLPLAERLLADGKRVVIFDLPGHGRSSGRTTALPEMARAIHAVAHEAVFTAGGEMEPLDGVIAHSLGAAALAMALRDGLAARSAVLLAPVAAPMAFVDPIASMLGLRADVRDGMVERIRIRAGGDLSRIDAVRAVAECAVPGLVVHDRDDARVPWAGGRAMAEAWPGARLVTTAGLGHRGVLEAPEVLDVVLAHVDRAAASIST